MLFGPLRRSRNRANALRHLIRLRGLSVRWLTSTLTYYGCIVSVYECRKRSRDLQHAGRMCSVCNGRSSRCLAFPLKSDLHLATICRSNWCSSLYFILLVLLPLSLATAFGMEYGIDSILSVVLCWPSAAWTWSMISAIIKSENIFFSLNGR